MKLTIRTADDMRAAEAQAQIHADQIAAQTYLDSTDWLIVRQAETGLPVPVAVLDRRAAARACLAR